MVTGSKLLLFLLDIPKTMKEVVLHFLSALAENNNRDWFTANKPMYEAAKKETEAFVNQVIPAIASVDETIKFVAAKDCMFRIFRDVRFSHDKSPYKTNMGAWITANGRKSSGPGYYLHLQPGGSFLSGGVYMPEPDRLKKIRSEMYYNYTEISSILNDPTLRKFAQGFDDMDRMKLPPREFPKDFEGIELLKNRHFVVTHPLDDGVIQGNRLLETVTEVFKAYVPLNNFLRKALLD